MEFILSLFQPLGRLHLWLLHLPIGLLGLQIFLEIVARWRGQLSEWQPALQILLKIGVAAAVAAAACGWLLAADGGYDFEVLQWHRWLGVSAAVAAVAAAYFFENEKIYLPILLGGGALLAVAGHFGGALTHGEGYLTEPFFQKNELAAADFSENLKEKVARLPDTAQVFEAIVQPILQSKCGSCHAARKSKGGLRLDSREAIQRGGEHGAVVVAGRADDSEIIRRASLPLADDQRMPPAGKPQLSAEELAFLKFWIAGGASFSGKAKDYKNF